jgi:hypothetical protein
MIHGHVLLDVCDVPRRGFKSKHTASGAHDR